MSSTQVPMRALPFEQLAAVELDPEFVRAVHDMFGEKMAFNRLLGLRLTRSTPLVSEAAMDLRPELIGHYAHRRIHGGAIAAALDTMGGLAVMNAIGARYQHEPLEQRLRHFMHLSTIDLRIDYLRPGLDEHYTLRAEVLRLGSRLASTRMEFMTGEGRVLALGTAAYMVA
ncbi:thioesterase family protein [Brachymonas sp.]|uniref:thioesterase family protein n=1 Tax=Brachymonas sp. TaxID=1936292 RepID=UPI0035B47015